MGLDFSHSQAHFSYGGFHQYRIEIGKLVGVNYDNPTPQEWEKLTKSDDPIKYLLDHSDCDGYITPARCEKLAVRLKEIVAIWRKGMTNIEKAKEALKGDENLMDKDFLISQTNLLIDGLEDAATCNEKFYFG